VGFSAFFKKIYGSGIKYEISRIYELMEILSKVSVSIIDPWMIYLSKNPLNSSLLRLNCLPGNQGWFVGLRDAGDQSLLLWLLPLTAIEVAGVPIAAYQKVLKMEDWTPQQVADNVPEIRTLSCGLGGRQIWP